MTLEQYRKKYNEVDEIFRGIPQEHLSAVQIFQFRKGMPLIEAGQYDDRLFIILEGLADIREEYQSGLRMTYYKITTGDVVGYYEILMNRPKRVASIMARTDVVAAIITKTTMLTWDELYPEFSKRINGIVISRLYDSNSLLAECSSYNLYRATITYLLYCYKIYHRQHLDDNTGLVRIAESRQNIAEFLGADVRSINRAVEKLKREGLVVIIKGKIHMDAEHNKRLLEIKNSNLEN